MEYKDIEKIYNDIISTAKACNCSMWERFYSNITTLFLERHSRLPTLTAKRQILNFLMERRIMLHEEKRRIEKYYEEACEDTYHYMDEDRKMALERKNKINSDFSTTHELICWLVLTFPKTR